MLTMTIAKLSRLSHVMYQVSVVARLSNCPQIDPSGPGES